MRCRARFVAIGFLPLILAGVAASPGAGASVRDLDRVREQYSDAVRAMDRKRWTEYEQLRSGLEDYPLAIYLDYSRLSREANRVRPADARRFIGLSEDSPLRNRFLSVYLHQAGRDRRWKDFLQVMPAEPGSVELKCYYFRARLAESDPLAAWEGAERLWVYGKSRPKQCDPLFDAWLKAGQLSDAVVWARLLQAFDARQRSLMNYVSRKGSPALKPWSDALLEVYRKPDRLRAQVPPGGDPRSADIAAHGVAHLARYDPEKALGDWRYYREKLDFGPRQVLAAESAIARSALLAREESMVPWLHEALARLGDDRLVEIRLRWTLGEGDWAALEGALPLLSPEGRQQAVWRYWAAVAREELGEKQRAARQFGELAGERGYYGFLAADRLGRDYSFNDRPLVLEPGASEPLLQLPAVQRIGELHYHGEGNLAYSEWFKVLEDTRDTGEYQKLAQLAYGRGWHRMAIDAANRARAWDALELRFPMPYRETFSRYAVARRLPSTELMAIARRESAFFPEARSPVGARGLMQVMPSTGNQVAASLGRSPGSVDLYGVEQNVLLGSAYYRQLLDRFRGNRVYALAAYNAGPHRVDRWRNKPGEALPVDIWIETIPYRETRDYVQAVLAYNVVFQYLMGDTRQLLTPAERKARY